MSCHERLQHHIRGHLATDPRPPGTKARQGHRPLLRIRVRDYRVVYEIRDSELVVLVVTLGHRKVYDRL